MPVMEEWITDDLSLAVYLHFSEYECEPIWKGAVCTFQFKDTPELREAITLYSSGDATVEPRVYNMAFSAMKSKMFNHPDAPSRKPKSGRR